MTTSYHDTRIKLYRRVRAGFTAQGKSLHKWCSENGVAMQNARAAILGIWTGRKADVLVKRIVKDAGAQ